MKRAPVILLSVWLLPWTGFAQPTPLAQPAWKPGGNAVVSRSGQFIIMGSDIAGRMPEAGSALVHLDAALLTVSCERIKQALLNTLNVSDQSQGKIRIGLYPFQDAGEDIIVTSERFANGWSYRMELPDAIEPVRLVRVITQVLLLEMANRNARDQSATLPLWLAEGMPQLLLLNSDFELVLPFLAPGAGNQGTTRSTQRNFRPADPLKKIRERLGRQPLMSLDELAEPPNEILAGENAEFFRTSALAFLYELLELKNGGAGLAAMLPELPWDPDWRIGFLKAFRSQFPRELDLAKWWALQSCYIVGATPAKTWTRAESLAKLDEILRCPLQVQTSTNDEPFHTDVPLQTWLRESAAPAQSQLLREKINLLAALRLRSAFNLAGLIDQYRQVLQTYLRDSGVENSRPTPPPTGAGRHPAISALINPGNSARELAVKAARQQLDVLDERRAAWSALPDTTPAPSQ